MVLRGVDFHSLDSTHTHTLQNPGVSKHACHRYLQLMLTPHCSNPLPIKPAEAGWAEGKGNISRSKTGKGKEDFHI